MENQTVNFMVLLTLLSFAITSPLRLSLNGLGNHFPRMAALGRIGRTRWLISLEVGPAVAFLLIPTATALVVRGFPTAPWAVTRATLAGFVIWM